MKMKTALKKFGRFLFNPDLVIFWMGAWVGAGYGVTARNGSPEEITNMVFSLFAFLVFINVSSTIFELFFGRWIEKKKNRPNKAGSFVD